MVGIDASMGMIENAATTTVPRRSPFAAAMAERLPFADAVVDLVEVTLSVSHCATSAAGLPRSAASWQQTAPSSRPGHRAARLFPPMTRRLGVARPGFRASLPF